MIKKKLVKDNGSAWLSEKSRNGMNLRRVLLGKSS